VERVGRRKGVRFGGGCAREALGKHRRCRGSERRRHVGRAIAPIVSPARSAPPRADLASTARDAFPRPVIAGLLSHSRRGPHNSDLIQRDPPVSAGSSGGVLTATVRCRGRIPMLYTFLTSQASFWLVTRCRHNVVTNRRCAIIMQRGARQICDGTQVLAVTKIRIFTVVRQKSPSPNRHFRRCNILPIPGKHTHASHRLTYALTDCRIKRLVAPSVTRE
jgi:hypothetical protein